MKVIFLNITLDMMESQAWEDIRSYQSECPLLLQTSLFYFYSPVKCWVWKEYDSLDVKTTLGVQILEYYVTNVLTKNNNTAWTIFIPWFTLRLFGK